MNFYKTLLVSIFLIINGWQTLAAQTNLFRISDDLFEIQMNDSLDHEIRILQVTDLHLGKEGFWKQDLTTFKRIKKLVAMHNPHLIAITGDLFTGARPCGSLLVAFAVQYFDSLERPWLLVFGNHDPEGGFGRDQIYQIVLESQWGILGLHPATGTIEKKYDYAITIITSGNDQPGWIIYAFDSGSEPGFKSIKPDQLLWYQNVSNKINPTKKSRAISIFHIPLKQYQDLWNDSTLVRYGESKEKVCFEEDDGSVYQAFVNNREIEATFCGHDHYNNFWGNYHGGIMLAYGYISGEATKYAWPTGGKLVKLPTDSGDIGIENVVPKFD